MSQSRLALKIQLLRYLKKQKQIDYDELQTKLAEIQSLSQNNNVKLYQKFVCFVKQNKEQLNQINKAQRSEQQNICLEEVDQKQLENDENFDSDWSLSSEQEENKQKQSINSIKKQNTNSIPAFNKQNCSINMLNTNTKKITSKTPSNKEQLPKGIKKLNPCRH